MTRHLHPLHWGEVQVDLGSEGVEPDLEEAGFFRYVDLLLLAQLGEILDLPLQFLQGPLKIETVSVRHFVSWRGGRKPQFSLPEHTARARHPATCGVPGSAPHPGQS